MVKISAQTMTGTQTCKNWNNKVIFALGINQSGKNKDSEVLQQRWEARMEEFKNTGPSPPDTCSLISNIFLDLCHTIDFFFKKHSSLGIKKKT